MARPQFAAAPPPFSSAVASGTLRVATIQFAAGSAQLDARDRGILKQVVVLQQERGGVLRVVGHASARTANMDPVRHKMVNYEVSEDRAQQVARTLLQLGAPAGSVTVTAKSDTDPIYYEFMPSGEAGNRRTEIYLDF
jgi:flagellar motor protein MotB